MTILHLIRHGRTAWHAGNRYAGSSDIELDDVGRAQAAGLAPWASTAGLTRVVSSDLRRAVETARVVSTAAGLPLTIDARLREMDFGDAEGLTAAEQAARFGAARRAFVASPASSPLPGGEPGTLVARRALAALSEAAVAAEAATEGDATAEVDAGRIAVVAHATTLRLVLCALLGIPLDDYRRAFPRLDNVAVTTVRLERGADRLRAGLIACNVAVAAPAHPTAGP